MELKEGETVPSRGDGSYKETWFTSLQFFFEFYQFFMFMNFLPVFLHCSIVQHWSAQSGKFSSRGQEKKELLKFHRPVQNKNNHLII